MPGLPDTPPVTVGPEESDLYRSVEDGDQKLVIGIPEEMFPRFCQMGRLMDLLTVRAEPSARPTTQTSP
jgi:hypothetical protein